MFRAPVRHRGSQYFYKRPLFYAAIAACVGIGLFELAGLSGLLSTVLVLAGVIVVFRLRKNAQVLLLVALCFGLWRAEVAKQYDRDRALILQYADQKVSITGVIDSEISTRISYRVPRKSFLLKISQIGVGDAPKIISCRGRVKVYASPKDLSLRCGDEIELIGTLHVIRKASNPGMFDRKAYSERLGVHALFIADKSSPVTMLRRDRGNPLLSLFIKLRQRLVKDVTRDFAPLDAGFLNALFFGDRSGLDDDIKDLFLKTGTTHLLAVSGFNVGFLIAVVGFLCMPFRLRRSVRDVLMIFAVWGYCALTQADAPILRASVMATILLVGDLIGRPGDLLNSLGLAALIILMINPAELSDVGFQLSFIAVWALSVFYSNFSIRRSAEPGLFREKESPFRRMCIYIEELFWVSWVCLFATLPITVQNFYIVSPMSLLANIAAVPLSFMIFFCGSAYFVTFLGQGGALYILSQLIRGLMLLFMGALQTIEKLPGSYIIVGKLDWWLWLILIGGLGFLGYTSKIGSRRKRAVWLALFALCIFVIQDIERKLTKRSEMTVLDVGQADSIYFQFKNGDNLLLDAASGGENNKSRWVVAPYLKSRGVRDISALVISHEHEDHLGGAFFLLEEFNVKSVYTSKNFGVTKLGKRLNDIVRSKRIPRYYLDTQSNADAFRGVKIEALYAGSQGQETPKKANENENSLILRIESDGLSFLMMGDAQEQTIRALLESGISLKTDVIKIPHHGRKLGKWWPELMAQAKPKIAVISRKNSNEIIDNPYGDVYATDACGSITVKSEGIKGSIRVETIL